MPVLIFRQGIGHVKFALILILSFIQFNLNIIISSISSRARPYAFSCQVNNVKRVSKIFCVFTMLTVFCIQEGWFVKCLVFYFEKETLKSLEWGSPLNCIVVRLEGLITPLDASPCTCKLPPYIRVFASYKYVLWYANTGTIAEVG